jgi:hypothetical protein
VDLGIRIEDRDAAAAKLFGGGRLAHADAAGQANDLQERVTFTGLE